MEGNVNGKRKIGENVEARGSEKMTVEKLERGNVDPEGDEEGQMEEQLRVGRPVKRRKKINGRRKQWTKNKKGRKGSSKLRKDMLPRGEEGNKDLNGLEQVEGVNDEVIQISSDDEKSEGIEISSDDDEREAIKGHQETANGKEEAKKELIKSLREQISTKSLELECPVCLNVCAPPIYSCLAQHPVCSGCRSTLKECPVCRELYDKRLIRHRSDDFFDFMVFFL